MRILWLAHRDPLNPRAGGAEKTINEVCIRLAKKGHKIILLTGGWKGCKSIENFQGIEIHRFGENLAPHLLAPFFLLKYHFDLVVNDLGHAVPWFSSTILNKHNIAFFRHLHARSLPGQVKPIIAKFITAIEKCYFILYHDTIFVTESSTSKSDLIKLGISDNKIVMNSPGVDSNLFKPVAKTQFSTIVYFGGMRRYKRPQVSILLLKRIIDRFGDIRLIIIGSGPEEGTLKKLSTKLGLQESISFKGRVSTEELSGIVASSWLNVHTSITEGWGYSILEASAAGTPTVAYEVPGVRDAIVNGINGIKVDDGNLDALTDAALSILRNPEKWWSSSVRMAKKYSWDKTAELWDNLFDRVTRKSK